MSYEERESTDFDISKEQVDLYPAAAHEGLGGKKTRLANSPGGNRQP